MQLEPKLFWLSYRSWYQSETTKEIEVRTTSQEDFGQRGAPPILQPQKLQAWTTFVVDLHDEAVVEFAVSCVRRRWGPRAELQSFVSSGVAR